MALFYVILVSPGWDPGPGAQDASRRLDWLGRGPLLSPLGWDRLGGESGLVVKKGTPPLPWDGIG